MANFKKIFIALDVNNLTPESENIFPHALVNNNLISFSDIIFRFSINSIISQLNTVVKNNKFWLTIHPGTNVNKLDSESYQNRLEQALVEILSNTPFNSGLLIENMVGTNKIMCDINELSIFYLRFVDKYPEFKKRLGTCLDTCHLYAFGYDIKKHEYFKTIFNMFLKKCNLKVIHLNDSKFEYKSQKDRHIEWPNGFLSESFLKSNLKDILKYVDVVLETNEKVFNFQEQIEYLYNLIYN